MRDFWAGHREPTGGDNGLLGDWGVKQVQGPVSPSMGADGVGWGRVWMGRRRTPGGMREQLTIEEGLEGRTDQGKDWGPQGLLPEVLPSRPAFFPKAPPQSAGPRPHWTPLISCGERAGAAGIRRAGGEEESSSGLGNGPATVAYRFRAKASALHCPDAPDGLPGTRRQRRLPLQSVKHSLSDSEVQLLLRRSFSAGANRPLARQPTVSLERRDEVRSSESFEGEAGFPVV